MSQSPRYLEWLPLWREVWHRDDPYRYEQDVYLDLNTSDILWVDRGEQIIHTVEEQAAILLRIEQEPSRYEWIPPLTHGEHHAIFARFLATLDRPEVGLCNSASIGGFLRDVRHHFSPEDASTISQEWYSFHDTAVQEHATQWFRELRIPVIWDAVA